MKTLQISPRKSSSPQALHTGHAVQTSKRQEATQKCTVSFSALQSLILATGYQTLCDFRKANVVTLFVNCDVPFSALLYHILTTGYQTSSDFMKRADSDAIFLMRQILLTLYCSASYRQGVYAIK